jgi:leucyl aminopeptidase
LTTFLTNFSSFPTRYYKNPSGTQSAEWLYTQINGIAQKSSANITVTKFAHSGYNQFSIIARIEGSVPGAPVVIMGAHQDSINKNNPSTGAAPGADDDGSGSAALYESFRILAGAGFAPKKPIEL